MINEAALRHDLAELRAAEVDLRRENAAPAPRARRSDPLSSHDAATELESSGALARQQRETLEAVYRWPSRTSREIAAASGLEYHAVARRLSELRVQLYVTRADCPGGCKWRVTEAGRAVVAALKGRR